MSQKPTNPSYGFLNQIADMAARQATKNIYDRLGRLERLILDTGVVTKPLGQSLDANGNLIQNLKDPTVPSDAVNLRYLQEYVANAFSTFKGANAAAGGGTPDGGGGDPSPDDGIPDHYDVVLAIWTATPVGPASTDEEVFRFTQKVAWALAGLGEDPLAGLLLKPSGANIFTCSGETYSYSRVCYSNGHIFKILIDADPGGARTPTWTDNGMVDVSSYHVATDPTGSC